MGDWILYLSAFIVLMIGAVWRYSSYGGERGQYRTFLGGQFNWSGTESGLKFFVERYSQNAVTVSVDLPPILLPFSTPFLADSRVRTPNLPESDSEQAYS